MKQLGLIKFAAGATLLLAALSPRAVRADSWDRKTTINFSDTVQIPGTTLPAGTYVFKLWDSQSDRYVVQIFNERQNHVFATLLTIPEYRMNAPDKTVVSFYEAPAGQPQPIKAWFYPGDNNGREFVYSKAEADLIARAAHEKVSSETVAVAQNSRLPSGGPQSPAVASQTEYLDSIGRRGRSGSHARASPGSGRAGAEAGVADGRRRKCRGSTANGQAGRAGTRPLPLRPLLPTAAACRRLEVNCPWPR